MQWQQQQFTITDDPERIDLATVIRFIVKESYWGRDFSTEMLTKAVHNSLCLSLFDGERQIGFARVVTDYATFGYVDDVYIDNDYRGQALGKWLMQCLLQHPQVKTLKKLMLTTADAHTLYTQYGFTALSKPDTVMERYNTELFSEFSWLD